MTNSIAIIDPFIKTPASDCFNRLVTEFNLRACYFAPAFLGISSLKAQRQNFNGYIVLGSASHVHENLPWHLPLSSFLEEELKLGKPVLGCCFGHQLMCHHFGARVEFYRPDEFKLIGSRTMTITKDFWNFKRGENFDLAVSHRQVVTNLTSQLIEVGQGLPYDVVIHQTYPFLGTQAHPECSDYFCIQEDQQIAERMKVQAAGHRFIEKFLRQFQLI